MSIRRWDGWGFDSTNTSTQAHKHTSTQKRTGVILGKLDGGDDNKVVPVNLHAGDALTLLVIGPAPALLLLVLLPRRHLTHAGNTRRHARGICGELGEVLGLWHEDGAVLLGELCKVRVQRVVRPQKVKVEVAALTLQESGGGEMSRCYSGVCECLSTCVCACVCV